MDIVERLRRTELHHVWDDLEGKMVGKMFSANPDGPEAADEIERLRDALRELVEAWDFWQSQETRSGFSELFANICEARAALAGEKKDG